jgi:C4-dicarboxylate-specific signal transduction histidine kinase
VGIASTDKRFLNQDYSFRDYFKSAMTGNNFIDVALGVTTYEMGYYFSAPIMASSSGEVSGVAVYKLRPEVLSQDLFGTVPFDFEFSLVDEFGVVVLSSDSEKIYSSLTELSEESKNKIAEFKRYGARKISALDYPELMNLLPEASTNSSRLISLEDSVDKKKEATTLYKVEGTPFYLMVEQDTSFLNQVSLRSAAMVASFVAVAALASIVIISFIIKIFLTPLEKITTFAKQIGEGKVGEKIGVKNNDEIGQLGQVINEMSDQLNVYKNSMEMRVSERTSEIEKSMDLMLGRELKMMELKKENKKLMEEKEKLNESAE